MVGVLVVSVGLAACGSSEDTAETTRERTDETRSAPTRPSSAPVAGATLCDLLPRDAVEAAFGEPVAAGPQSSDECWWSTANDLKTVNLIRRSDDVATWRSGYDNRFWVPNDFGDEGYTGTALTSIVWRIGPTQYEVNVVYSTRGEPEQVVEELAEGVATRL